jgi:hypothetical protein
LFFFTLATTLILNSYSKYNGTVTNNNVNISAVGVIIAARIHSSTTACFLYLTSKDLSIKSNLARKYAIIGISKSIPNNNESTKRVEIYEFNAIWLITDS